MTTASEAADQLIHGYDLQLAEIPCIPGSPAWNAKATIEQDIRAVLPYLNAALRSADYHHELETLIWKEAGRKHAFRPHEISIAPVEDREQARCLLDEAVGIVNRTWKNRGEIQPTLQRRQLPSFVEIYRLLPRTNCKECGYLSCMAFAAQVREGNAQLAQCPYFG